MHDGRTISAHVLQPERQRGLVIIGKHVLEEGLCPGPFTGITAVFHKSAIGTCLSVLRRLWLILPLHQRPNFGKHHLDGHMVGDDVMNRQRAITLLLPGNLAQHHPHQRRPAKVKSLEPGLQPLTKRPCSILPGIQHHPRTDWLCVTLHDLHRLGQIAPHEYRAQSLMAPDQFLQRGKEGLEACHRIESKHLMNHIGIPLLIQPVMKQNALLGRRQRVDVLDVGRTARHPGHDRVDLGLSEAGQPHHLRQDLCACFENSTTDSLPCILSIRATDQLGRQILHRRCTNGIARFH